MTWEVNQGEISVEMPTSPPVVKRSLAGSAHINGAFSQISVYNSNTSISVADATNFPASGSFWLQPILERQNHIITPSENVVVSQDMNTRLMAPQLQRYTYASRIALTTTGDIAVGSLQITNLASTVGLVVNQQVSMTGVPPYSTITSIVGSTVGMSHAATANTTAGAVSFLGNTLSGITPNLPALASTNEYTMTSLVRTSNVVTGTTAALTNGISPGDEIIITGSSGITPAGQALTGNTSTGSNQITALAGTGLALVAPGMLIAGPNILPLTYVLAIAGTTVTMTQGATGNNTGAPYSFSESLDGGFTVQSVSGNQFTYNLIGSDGTSTTAGTVRYEIPGLAPTGSVVYVTNAISNKVSRIIGPYIWDLSAPFVLSQDMGTTADTIQAGKIVRLLNLGPNTIPSTGGFLIFDYGLESQEGPVRYLYKPTDDTIALDPSYTFKFNHSIGSAMVLIETMGPHAMSGHATEYPPYITDPSAARVILEGLITSVKSSGIFVNFLINYPEQLYGVLDVYNEQGLGAGEPFSG
jgi:hypothetical protein